MNGRVPVLVGHVRGPGREDFEEADDIISILKIILVQVVCPGSVVMGGDSCSKAREFESQHCILIG